MAKQIQHASRYLGASDSVAALLTAIEQNRKLLKAVRSKLPPPLDAHCLHAGLNEGVLTLITDSPVWGSRLRFFGPELTRKLEERYGRVETCRIRVQPLCARPLPEDGGRAARRLSAGTVKLLLDAADGLGDTDLALALRRLASAGAARG